MIAFQRTSQTVQAELIDLVQSGGVLEIVLDDIDIIGGGQQTGELGSFRVPQRSGNNACTSRFQGRGQLGVRKDYVPPLRGGEGRGEIAQRAI